jgi:hypothetical protein
MSIKTTIPVYSGPVSAGLTRHVIPSMQGYGRGVLLLRVTNKATDGDMACTFAELVTPAAADGWTVDEIIFAPAESRREWRVEASLPAINYEVHTFLHASAADVEITLIAS